MSTAFGAPIEHELLEKVADDTARHYLSHDVAAVEKRLAAVELLFGTTVAVTVGSRAEELANEYEREAWIEYQTELAIERAQDRQRERWEDWADRTDFGLNTR